MCGGLHVVTRSRQEGMHQVLMFETAHLTSGEHAALGGGIIEIKLRYNRHLCMRRHRESTLLQLDIYRKRWGALCRLVSNV